MTGTIRYGWQTPSMAHYPTTAELAAFRREIARESCDGGHVNRHEPMCMPTQGGAWVYEVREGIGFSFSWLAMDSTYPWITARRAAAAMRSRAYDAAHLDEHYAAVEHGLSDAECCASCCPEHWPNGKPGSEGHA